MHFPFLHLFSCSILFYMKRVFQSPISFLLLVAVLVFSVVGFRYYEYVVNRNFIINVYTACNPSTEQCFVSDCSPEDDLSCPNGPYKKIEIRDADAPQCLEEHTCTNFICGDIASCTATYCSEENLEEGESCAGTSTGLP